eukprot:GILI01002486.1.p1 GENE.GILI01002486.1~~GILI01002486.1.p1  ORF type:complete len:602 (+),score=110.97 GILI01002486.1:123-1928(+)
MTKPTSPTSSNGMMSSTIKIALPEKELKKAETDFKSFFRVFTSKLSQMDYGQIAFLFLLIAAMMAGNAIQIIGLNSWLRSFPGGGHSGSYTILTLSGIIFAIVFSISLAVYYFTNRKADWHFAKDYRGWVLLFGIGFVDTLNSWMNIYAANHTPEVMQALLMSLMPIFTCILTKLILSDPRSYNNRWIYLSFGFTIAGVLIAVVPDFVGFVGAARKIDNDEDDSSKDSPNAASFFDRYNTILWCSIFSLSVPFTALMNVWQTKYMEDYTEVPPTLIELLSDSEGDEHEEKDSGKAQQRERDFPSIQITVTEKELSSGSFRKHHHHPSPVSVKLEKFAGALDESHHTAHHGIFRNTRTEHTKGERKGFTTTASADDDDDERSSKATEMERVGLLSTLPKEKPKRYSPTGSRSVHRYAVHQQGEEAHSDSHASCDDDEHVDGRCSERPYKGDDTSVKMLMLFGDTFFQAILSLMMLPADALPWWGGSATVSEAADHFVSNTLFIATDEANTFGAIFYSSGFILTYIGGAYLNQYSPTLCSMVSQLSSPMTALVLILVPAWNLEASGGAWYWSVVAVILLSIGTLLYSAWEEMSSQEEAREGTE